VFFEVDQAVPFTLTGTSISLAGSGAMVLHVRGNQVGNQDIEHGFSVNQGVPPEALSVTVVLQPGRYAFDFTVIIVAGCNPACSDASTTLDYSLVFDGEAGQVRVVEAPRTAASPLGGGGYR
jgi:hypothetical protein